MTTFFITILILTMIVDSNQMDKSKYPKYLYYIIKSTFDN